MNLRCSALLDESLVRWWGADLEGRALRAERRALEGGRSARDDWSSTIYGVFYVIMRPIF